MRRFIACLAASAAALVSLVALPEPAAAFTTTRGFIASFDGTPIVYNLFIPATAGASTPVPLIMQTHGWGGTGSTAPGGVAARLVNEGYAVVTWDSRGFGASGGEVHIDDPAWEGRDASALLTAIAARPDIAKTNLTDPVVGMIGGSYAGGIQLTLAAHDSRIDAIAPEITWNDLRTSLFPNGVIKHTWAQTLFAAGLATSTGLGLDPRNPAGMQTGNYAPFILEDYAIGLALGATTQKLRDDFTPQGVAGYGATNPVAVPTLLLQGKTDTLFNLNEAARNLAHVQANGAPAKLISYCGGHAGCPAGYLDSSYGTKVSDAISTWFERYLKGATATDTGPVIEYSTRDGAWHSLASLPSIDAPGEATLVSATGAGTIVATGGPNPTDTALVERASSGPSTLRIPITTAGVAGLHVVGTPRATVTVSGVGTGAHLFFKLVDREDNDVLDGQAQALRVENLVGGAQTFTFDLVAITELVRAGHTLELEVTAANLNHLNYRGPAVLDITAAVTVPTV